MMWREIRLLRPHNTCFILLVFVISGIQFYNEKVKQQQLFMFDHKGHLCKVKLYPTDDTYVVERARLEANPWMDPSNPGFFGALTLR